jgi:hypothetical protein
VGEGWADGWAYCLLHYLYFRCKMFDIKTNEEGEGPCNLFLDFLI